VGYEKRFNPSIQASKTEDKFVDFILDGQPEPPLYFARMKRQNKEGPPLLQGKLPEPRRLFANELRELTDDDNAIVVDTRGQEAFAEGFLPGSLSAPVDKQFNTVAGSYIRENQSIYLIIEERHLKQAIRDLIRIGLDNIEGFATPQSLDIYHEKGYGELDQLPVIDFEKVRERQDRGDRRILDVRKYSEYQQGHLPNAINKAHTRLLETADDLDKEPTYMVHCQAGGRASVAAALLKSMGFKVEWVNDHFDRLQKTLVKQ
jgi:hydroxyacylglutathione hydrolase